MVKLSDESPWVVYLSPEQMERAIKRAYRVNENKEKHKTGNPYFDTTVAPGSQVKSSWLGEYGQEAMAEKYGLPIDDSLKKYGDGGRDFILFGRITDVKAARKATFLLVKPHLIKRNATERYILAEFTEPNRIALLGWATKAEVATAPITNFGFRDNLSVLREDLHDMESIREGW